MTIKAVFPAAAQPMLAPHLPAIIEAHWFRTPEEAIALAADAEIGWLDMQPPHLVGNAIAAAERIKWVSTLYAGLDAFPLDLLAERGAVLTNGVGINAVAVAEYTVLGMLSAAKRYDEVVRISDRREWPLAAPGTQELFGSSALIVGMGTIGQLVADRLKAFGVSVTGVTRSGRDGTLTPDQWRARIGDFDWIVLAAPSTGETKAMFGAEELAAMKPSAWLVNIARGDMVDQEALVEALRAKAIGGAFLDVADPEPLPAHHPLWDLALLSMHFSGRSTTGMFERAGTLFLDNLRRYLAGEPLRNQVDLALGY